MSPNPRWILFCLQPISSLVWIDSLNPFECNHVWGKVLALEQPRAKRNKAVFESWQTSLPGLWAGKVLFCTTCSRHTESLHKSAKAFNNHGVKEGISVAITDTNVSCLSRNWRKRSSVKIAERTYEKRA